MRHTAHSTESLLVTQVSISPAFCLEPLYLLGAKPGASLASLDCAGELFDTAGLNDDILPSLIKNLLDLFRYVNDERYRDHFVPSMDKSIENLIEPEGVLYFAVLLEVCNLTPVQDLTFTS